MLKVYYYSVENQDKSPVIDFINSLSEKEIAKVYRNIVMLKELGHAARRPLTDTVRGKVRELRIELAGNQFRLLYYFCVGDWIIFLHGFRKKTEAIRSADIELAEKRMLDFQDRLKKNMIMLK